MVTTRDAPTPATVSGGRIGEGEYADEVAAQTRALWAASALVLESLVGTDDLTASVTPALDTAYVAGMSFWLAAQNDNSGAMTLNINGQGVKDLVQQDGNPMEEGDIAAGSLYLLTYDGVQFRVVNMGAAAAGGGGGGDSSVDFQTFTASGTWTKPAVGTVVLIRAWGGGASGGRGGANDGGGGGGGGAFVERLMVISLLGATETVTIGAGGAAVTVDNTAGNVGGNTTFGVHVTAYGGGGGNGNNADPGGGGGGGMLGAGATSTGTLGANGGAPASDPELNLTDSAAASVALILGSGAQTNAMHGMFNFAGGGGGGAGTSAGTAIRNAGDSIFGGGGGGGQADGSATTGVGGRSIWGGGGGGGGSNNTVGGSGGTSLFGGNGGAGGFDANAGTAGTQPGGGGGGSETGNSGAGGDGQVQVITW